MAGYVLPSQDIRELIKNGRIQGIEYNDLVEKRIQTNSYEPTIGDTGYWVDEQIVSHLRTNTKQPIAQTLADVPDDQKKKFSLVGGQTLHVGHTYLFLLTERLSLEQDEYVKVSPKSSVGRTFIDSRAFADGHPCSDIIHPRFCNQHPVQVWLMVKPLKFNIIVHPGISLNQFRFFKGVGARLSRAELEAEHKKTPILQQRTLQGLQSLQNPLFTEDGLLVNLCLHSRNQNNMLEALEVNPGDCLILFTQEVFCIPPHLSAEMRPYSLTNIRGPLHFAGFFDNGFHGDAVIELQSEEKGTVLLNHNAPIAEFEFYRTRVEPDKVYGDKKSGSHYAGQFGPKMAKYFKQIDLTSYVALRAKKTPFPIDLSKKYEYEVLDYFDIY